MERGGRPAIGGSSEGENPSEGFPLPSLMRCPSCHYDDTKVTDSRVANAGMAIRRRRECLRCGFRFSTYEEVEILNLTVIKRDGHKEPYSREKLEVGVRKSFEKRPITHEDFRKLISRIERDLQIAGKSEVTTRQIGEVVMRHLKRIDEVAYIRFASVYRSFRDAETFQRELRTLLTRTRAPRRIKKTKVRSKRTRRTATRS